MLNASGSSPVRFVLMLFAVFVVGLGGVFAGLAVRGRVASKPQVILREPTSLLRTGTELPGVDLMLADGSLVASREFIGDGGCVVLFLDLECPPCYDMVAKWEAARVVNGLEDIRVVGITNYPVDAIEAYRAENGITFPVAVDPDQVYRHEYDVNRFPLEVVIGKSGRIRSLSYFTDARVDVEGLTAMLAD